MDGERESLHHGYRVDGGINAVELSRARANWNEIRAVPFIAMSRAPLFLVAAIAATALIGWFTAAGPHPLASSRLRRGPWSPVSPASPSRRLPARLSCIGSRR
jgi:hypothetical protein